MNTRILIFSVAYEPLIGGAELAVRNITDRLSSLEFDLITCRFSRKHKAQERIGKVNVYRVGFGGRLGRYLYPALAFRLASKLEKHNPYQIVWSIMAAYAGAAALMFLRRFPEVRFLLTLQEGDPIEHIHRQVRGFRKQWQKLFKRADHIQAISQYLADWARTEGAKCPIEVVPNGVDFNKIKNHPPQRTKIRNVNQKLKIISVSRLVPKNGIDILIRAAAVLKFQIFPLRGIFTTNSKFQIQILGQGPELKKLKKLVKDLQVADIVEFTSSVLPDRVSAYLGRADIFVRPSRSEGLGSAFLEAMAAGLPVIGTAVGGISEFLHPLPASLPPGGGGKGEGEDANGLFVKVDDPRDLAEKIKLLLQDENLRQKLGQNGRKLVKQKYNWDSVASAMGAIFQTLIQ